MGKLICGIGFNDGKYFATSGGKITDEYEAWRGMLIRCTKAWCGKHPTYTGVSCSTNFKNYSFFYEWYHQQIGAGRRDEKGNKWQMDKDLLVRGNKLYDENACVFIPQRINKLLIKSDATRGCFPIGVSFSKCCGSYQAACKKGNGKSSFLGRYPTQEIAFLAYKTFKEALIKQVANEYRTQLDPRAYQALLNYTVEITD